MRLRDYRLNLALAVVRELHRLLPMSPMTRAMLLATCDWACQAHRAGSLATVTRLDGPPWAAMLGRSQIRPFLTYRPDREGD